MAWYEWNHRNHTLQSKNGPMKFEIIRLIDKIFFHNLKNLVQVFLVNATLFFVLSTTLYSPDLSTTPIMTIRYRQHNKWSRTPSARTIIPDMNELLLGRTSLGILITSLNQFEEHPALRTTLGPTLYRYNFVERK